MVPPGPAFSSEILNWGRGQAVGGTSLEISDFDFATPELRGKLERNGLFCRLGSHGISGIHVYYYLLPLTVK